MLTLNTNHIIYHSFIDSLKTIIIIFIFHIIFSFIEDKITNKLFKNNKLSPLISSISGFIPQCGISVIGANLYVKNYISIGTILSLFIACSDESLLILLSDISNINIVLPLLITKFLLAIITGYTIDILFKPVSNKTITNIDINTHCCHNTNKYHKHLLHPLIHSLKLFVYIFLINLTFTLLIEIIGEITITNFIQQNQTLSPLFAVMIGLIPNCASSIIISKLYLLGGINFSAALVGLSVNAGLGTLFLIKNEKNKKKALTIMLTLISISLIAGYISLLISYLI